MKPCSKKISILFILILSVLSAGAFADTYKYHADVKGMVCAFCAYSVSKNISKLPGVDADSVNIDLKGGQLDFNSSQIISNKELSELFIESGFTVSNLSYKKTSKNTATASADIILDLKIDAFKTDQFIKVIETIGAMAANSSARLIIKSPPSQEDTILKPLLMGRQQVVKVQFIPVQSDIVHIRLTEISD
ncbi:hypothetical protein MNBD_GAMMA09-2816 [hydrothermal vent metagenome]|uniref:HMA domain-containing protein n=1 Tax=hydrothermal vent metagenome TaxID=652676 RepID=A0A3B0XEJ3_9ZZZZ